MKTIQGIMVWLVIWGWGVQTAWAQMESTPSPFSLTYFEFYGTPIEPLNYAQLTTDALGFDVLAEYNPSFYASVGLNYEKVRFFDSLNTTVSFVGVEARLFAAPNGQSPFAPYVYGGAGLGLNSGTGNELKAGLGSRLQLLNPIFLDFSAGSNWLDSGLQYLNFRGGLSLSFDLPKVAQNPMSSSNSTQPANSFFQSPPTPMMTATSDLTPSTPTPTMTPILEDTETDTPTPTVVVPVITNTPQMQEPTMESTHESRVKIDYLAGIRAFRDHDYQTSMMDFRRALKVKDRFVPVYFYAESNDMIGVIYQFYSKKIRHDQLAIEYYKRALKIDPRTKIARKHLNQLERLMKKRRKTAAVENPDSDSSVSSTSSEDSTMPIDTSSNSDTSTQGGVSQN